MKSSEDPDFIVPVDLHQNSLRNILRFTIKNGLDIIISDKINYVINFRKYFFSQRPRVLFLRTKTNSHENEK